MVTAALAATPAWSAPHTTVQRTIQDTDGDNLLDEAPGEDYTVLPAGDPTLRPPRNGSLLNFLQLSDFQTVDEESPGRVEFLDGSQRISGLNPFSAAYRPQESLSTQTVEAMVRQARNTTSPVTGEKLDLTILTGDNADSQQYNETRWFIDTLDGTAGSKQKIDPNSGVEGTCGTVPDGSLYDGVRDNGSPGIDNGYYEPDSSNGQDGDGYSPRRAQNAAETLGKDVTVRDFPGLFEAAQKPFEAVGLGMPWYSAFGNHDALVQGNSPDAFVGPLGPSGETVDPGYDGLARGCLKPSRLPAAITPDLGQTEEETFLSHLPSMVTEANAVNVPRDDRRCYLSKDTPTGAQAPCTQGWIGEHSVTTGLPKGHGFELFSADGQSGTGRPDIARLNHDGYYSFNPRSGVRFVVLDTITDECGAPICAEGSVDDDQFQWMESQFRDAAAHGEYVLVFSHHTLDTIRQPSTDPFETPLHFGQRTGSPPGGETLEESFCAHPNVLAHVNGHEHQNDVERHDCPEDPGGPEPPQNPASFYEVTTAAHIDFPQQSRTIELVRNDDGTISLVLTILDHDGPPNPGASKSDAGGASNSGDSVLRLASISRELAFNDYQGDRGAGGSPSDRNVIIKTGKSWPLPPSN